MNLDHIRPHRGLVLVHAHAHVHVLALLHSLDLRLESYQSIGV